MNDQHPASIPRMRYSQEPIMTTSSTTLYDQLGGDEALMLLVDGLFAKVLADDELTALFAGENLGRLRERQLRFLTSAFQGPRSYRGRPLVAIHSGMPVATHHFALVLAHLSAVLHELEIDDATVAGVLSVLSDLSSSILPSLERPTAVTTIDDLQNGNLFGETHDESARLQALVDEAQSNIRALNDVLAAVTNAESTAAATAAALASDRKSVV